MIWAEVEILVPGEQAAGMAVIRAEHTAFHVVALPVRGAARKAAALPYALEGEIGSALETTHVAYCGTAGTAGETLATVVSAEVMRQAIAERPDQPIIAEVTLLSRPEPGPDGSARWRCLNDGNRVLVRASDGTGFAARADVLVTLWHLAGQPPVENYGTPLLNGITAQHDPDTAPPLSDPGQRPDLRQERFRPDRNLGRPMKWLAAACVLAAAGHLGIAAADARAQRQMADELRTLAQTALARHLPGASAETAPALLHRQLASLNRVEPGSGFLSLMNGVSTALSKLPDTVQFRQLSWADDTLRLTLEAPNLESLQRAEVAILEAGLRVSTGSAMAEGGSARADLTVRP
ncbi:hypothetical protein JQV38_20145 [Sulfitobacter mediterraneus]|nr:hypothetical protein [Sulfitobacter mediterraneus]